MNIMMLLEMAAATFPDRTAFVDGNSGERLSYQALFDNAGQHATQIRTGGYSRVGMLDVSSLATPTGLFAAAWAGTPYVPINYRLTQGEIEALLARITPAKAAVLRQKHLVSYILGSVEFACADEDEAALVCVPPYHIAGIAAILSSVYSGRRVVQLADFSAERWIELVREEKVSTAFVVPTMLSRIVETLQDQTSADMPHLKSLSYGGGKMPLSVIERAMQLFPDTDFTNAYGLTETSSTVAVLGPDDHRAAAGAEDATLKRRLVSVGTALPGVEIEIRDDEGNPVAPGERGEIYVRGEQVSGEYEGRGPVTDSDGWFPTRDAGSMDSEGYLFLEGRADDVIVRGGENMSPGEIEDVLLEHSAVKDAAIVGIPSEQWGEAVAAAVVLKADAKADASELKEWVKTNMRSSRVPETLEFWEELPYNETGKLLRRVVKEQLSTA